jgi:hypothetical protein
MSWGIILLVSRNTKSIIFPANFVACSFNGDEKPLHDQDIGLVADVTGIQRILYPPTRLITPLVYPWVRDGANLYCAQYFLWEL